MGVHFIYRFQMEAIPVLVILGADLKHWEIWRHQDLQGCFVREVNGKLGWNQRGHTHPEGQERKVWVLECVQILLG